MKGKKLSAFAVLHGKQSSPSRSHMKEFKGVNQNGIQKKKKKRNSSANIQKEFTVKESLSYSNLNHSPSTSKARRSSSCPSTHDSAHKAAREMQQKNNRPPKVSTPKSAKIVKRESCAVVTSPPTVNSSKSALQNPYLSDLDQKDEKATPAQLPDSKAEAIKCFDWLINPVESKKFFAELWEKKPLLVKRHKTSYYKGIFSCSELDTILKEKTLYFTKNVDITTYINGHRETHNPNGRAYPGMVWDYYSKGCSVRLLNPQTYSKSVWKLNSILQEYFGSCVGANVYLTPPGTQGFAPHYDDIEAFILQLEGRKRWKLYNPRDISESLPRFSSENFRPGEIGEPILNIELEPGDLLYFPRGTIHQASTPDDTHSLHITVSTYQRNSWGDFLEKLLPRALQLAIEENSELREGLPQCFLNYMGVAHSDKEDPRRLAFMEKLNGLMAKVSQYVTVDACADQMGKTYMHDCLPPLLTKAEKACSVHAGKQCWKEGLTRSSSQLDLNVSIRLIRANVLRLVTDENTVCVYHSMDNSREYHREEPQFFEISYEFAPAIEVLLHSYPQFIRINDLPLDEKDDKLLLANTLYGNGLLMTSNSGTSV